MSNQVIHNTFPLSEHESYYVLPFLYLVFSCSLLNEMHMSITRSSGDVDQAQHPEPCSDYM